MISDVERMESIPRLSPRPRAAHKGEVGRVLVVSGSQGMIGAPSLVANAALRSGAGLVTVATPRIVQPFVATLCPCAISVPLACEGDDLAMGAVAQVAREMEKNDVLAVGPGLRVGLPQRMLTLGLLAQTKPVVLDADGLNNLTQIDDWPARRRAPMVLTPHPGEMARLVGRTIGEIQDDREQSALSAIRDWLDQETSGGTPLVLVLKGAGTIVTDGRRIFTCKLGNAGMATGGTGDVLTGVIAALIGQKLAPFDAAVLGVHIHAAAGDAAAARLGQVSLIATDVVEELPHAFLQTQRG